MTGRDAAESPQILLDARLGVVHVSAAAQRWLGEGSVLTVRQQRLHSPGDPQALSRGLDAAIRGRRTALCLARPARAPLTLCAEPRPAAGGVLVTLRDPELEVPDTALLQDLFGLTRTEAVIAAGLAQGFSSAELAAAMGVQPNTVLSHIKRVLLKSGARRQSQLVSLILRSAAMPALPWLAGLAPLREPSLVQVGNGAAPANGKILALPSIRTGTDCR